MLFDGFDIQILGFAIPSLMRGWGVPRSAFAPVLAVGLAGMAAGSPFAGYWGDRWGRRPALIGCMTIFGVATVARVVILFAGDAEFIMSVPHERHHNEKKNYRE